MCVKLPPAGVPLYTLLYIGRHIASWQLPSPPPSRVVGSFGSLAPMEGRALPPYLDVSSFRLVVLWGGGWLGYRLGSTSDVDIPFGMVHRRGSSGRVLRLRHGHISRCRGLRRLYGTSRWGVTLFLKTKKRKIRATGWPSVKVAEGPACCACAGP